MEDSAAIRREIAAARARIADTAEALVYRADVKARLNEEIAHRVAGAKTAARERIAELGKSFSGAARGASSGTHDLVEDIAPLVTGMVAGGGEAIEAARPQIVETSKVAADAARTASAAAATARAATEDAALAATRAVAGAVETARPQIVETSKTVADATRAGAVAAAGAAVAAGQTATAARAAVTDAAVHATRALADAVETARPQIVEGSKAVADASRTTTAALQNVADVVVPYVENAVDAGNVSGFPARNLILFAIGSFAASLVLWLLFSTRNRDESQDRDAA